MHHWSTRTYLTLPRARDVKKVRQFDVLRMAVEYHFLMNQLLVIAWFHLAFLHPDRCQFYALQASQHQSHAVRRMRKGLAEITADNSHALFATLALLVLGAHAAVSAQSERLRPTVEDKKGQQIGRKKTTFWPLLGAFVFFG